MPKAVIYTVQKLLDNLIVMADSLFQLNRTTLQSFSMISCGNTEPTVLVQVNSVKQSGTFCSALLLRVNLLKPTGYVMHHQFNIQQLYALPALYLGVLYLSEEKNSDLCHLQHKLIGFYNRDEKFQVHGSVHRYDNLNKNAN